MLCGVLCTKSVFNNKCIFSSAMSSTAFWLFLQIDVLSAKIENLETMSKVQAERSSQSQVRLDAFVTFISGETSYDAKLFNANSTDAKPFDKLRPCTMRVCRHLSLNFFFLALHATVLSMTSTLLRIRFVCTRTLRIDYIPKPFERELPQQGWNVTLLP